MKITIDAVNGSFHYDDVIEVTIVDGLYTLHLEDEVVRFSIANLISISEE